MNFESRNPATGELLGTYPEHREEGMKDQKKIRLGLIGVGNWALFAHVRVLRLLPEYEIVAIYSQRKEAAKAAATEYGIPHVADATSHHREYPRAVRHYRRAHGGNALGGSVNSHFCFSATSKYYPFQKERGTIQ